MKSLKVLLVSFILLGAMSFYLGGCSPAETTTGKLAYQQKNWEKAAAELTKGLAIDKTDAEAWYMLGYSQTELGNFKEGAEAFKQATALSPDYNNQIKIYWIDKYNAGINAFNSGVKELGKKNTEIANNYFKDAIKSLTAATGIVPDSIAAYQLMADSYNYMGQTEKALGIYQSILDRSKSKDDALAIAKILNRIGLNDRVKAFEYSESISKIQGEDEKSKEEKIKLGNAALDKWNSVGNIFKKISEIQYLPKESEYYQAALYNVGLANYQKASVIFSSGIKDDYKNHLNDAIIYLLKLTELTKDKSLLKDSYEILLGCYEALNNEAKMQEIKSKLDSLK